MNLTSIVSAMNNDLCTYTIVESDEIFSIVSTTVEGSCKTTWSYRIADKTVWTDDYNGATLPSTFESAEHFLIAFLAVQYSHR